MYYRKKPVVIQAKQWTGENASEIVLWAQGGWRNNGIWVKQKENEKPILVIPTLEGDHDANVGDWIIKGVKGEHYPCKPEIFDLTYEEVENE